MIRSRIRRLLNTRQAPILTLAEYVPALGTAVLSDTEALRAHGEAQRNENARIRCELDEIRALVSTSHQVAYDTNRVAISTHEHLLSANHLVVVTHDEIRRLNEMFDQVKQLVESLNAQMTAERDATMASNDGVRRRMTDLADEITQLFAQMPAISNLQKASTLIADAERLVDVARSQYVDTLPQDASDFAPVAP